MIKFQKNVSPNPNQNSSKSEKIEFSRYLNSVKVGLIVPFLKAVNTKISCQLCLQAIEKKLTTTILV